MKKLTEQLSELKLYSTNLEVKNEIVSRATVGWHIDHSLRVINGIIKAMEQSDTSQYRNSFNLWRSIFLTLNFLPRGKARAPKRVLPDGVITENELMKQLGFAHDHLNVLQSLPSNAHFQHPVFGQLNRKQSEKFLQIHTEHHLKIIRDIFKG